MTNVLVTGGAGFIGSHMVDLLIGQGFSVRVLDNMIAGKQANLSQHKNNSKLIVDERDIRVVNEKDSIYKDIDYVYHFAGIGDIVPSIDSPEEYMSVNTQGTVKVCEGARINSIKKLYYSIGEVSKVTELKQYVLRYWETEFKQLNPSKNKAGNRTYRQKDIDVILNIKDLLYNQKFTIDGARKMLSVEQSISADDSKSESNPEVNLDVLIKIRTELKSILDDIRNN